MTTVTIHPLANPLPGERVTVRVFEGNLSDDEVFKRLYPRAYAHGHRAGSLNVYQGYEVVRG